MEAAQLVKLAISVSIMLIVFALGMRAPPGAATFLLREPRLLLCSVLAMNVVHPLMVALFVSVFDLRVPVRIALLALALSPVPPFVPGKELKIVARDDYIFGLLFVTAVLSIVLVPLSVKILAAVFGVSVEVSAAAIARIVAMTVIVPLVAGHIVQRLAPQLAARLSAAVNVFGMILLIAAALVLVMAEWRTMVTLIGEGTLFAIAAFTLAGLVAGYVLGGPNEADRTVLSLSTASRHPAVAIAVATACLPNETSIPAAVLLALIVSGLVTAPYVAWRKRVHTKPARPGDTRPHAG